MIMPVDIGIGGVIHVESRIGKGLKLMLEVWGWLIKDHEIEAWLILSKERFEIRICT